jgi:hypothetical protein
MEKPEKPHFGYVLFSFLMCIGGIATEFHTVHLFQLAQEIQTWPKTTGLVVQSEIKETINDYTARVVYTYEVGGKSYSSSEIRVRGTTSKSESEAMSFVRKYPVGAEVSVFYLESDPTKAYLEAGLEAAHYVMIISPVVCSLVMGLAFFALIQMRRQHNDQSEDRDAILADHSGL